MQTLEQLRGKVDTARDLLSVVKTMKGLAAVNIRQYSQAAESLEQYYQTVEMGFRIFLHSTHAQVILRSDASDRPERTLAILFGSDQGMVGQFNARIQNHAMETLAEWNASQVIYFAAGNRLAGDVAAQGREVSRSVSLPRSIAGAAERVQDLLLSFQEYRRKQDVGRIVVFHNMPTGGASYKPVTRRVLPLDLEWLRELRRKPWVTKVLPDFRTEPDTLPASLIRQYLFVVLYRAFAASMAAENASRLSSMQAAQRNIEDRLAGLETRYQQRRQAEITSELLDVMAGFEAVKKDQL